MCACVCVFVCVCVCMRVCACVCMRVHVCMGMFNDYIRKHMCICMNVHNANKRSTVYTHSKTENEYLNNVKETAKTPLSVTLCGQLRGMLSLTSYIVRTLFTHNAFSIFFWTYMVGYTGLWRTIYPKIQPQVKHVHLLLFKGQTSYQSTYTNNIKTLLSCHDKLLWFRDSLNLKLLEIAKIKLNNLLYIMRSHKYVMHW